MTVRTDVLKALEAGCETNVEIAEFTGHQFSVVSSCTRRMLMDEVIVTPSDFKAGQGHQRHYFLNPLHDGREVGKRYVEEFRIPAPDPVLAAFFGLRVKCESS